MHNACMVLGRCHQALGQEGEVDLSLYAFKYISVCVYKCIFIYIYVCMCI